MNTRAAVLEQPKGELRIQNVDLSAPKQGEILVRMKAIALCHTDILVKNGDLPAGMPVILGHEGAGIVEEVGPDVVGLEKGDHVLLAAVPHCGCCPPCLAGQPYICDNAGPIAWQGVMPDGTRRFSRNGQDINHFWALSTFSEHTVVPARQAIKVPTDVPLDKIAGLSCGFATGIGAVLKTARIPVGATVAVFGLGSLGLSAVMAAKLAGASTIIGVGRSPWKLDLGLEVGATHVINARQEDPVARIRELTGRGADYTFECSGVAAVVEQAIASIAAGGMAVLAGAPPAGQMVSIDPLYMLLERSIKGSPEGSEVPGVDLPKWVGLFQQGRLPIDRLVTRTYTLDQINEAIADLERGALIKGVIVV